MAESRPPLLPPESISRRCARLSMLLSEGNAFCSSGFRLACGLNGQSLLFVAIMQRRKGKKARALCYSRGVVFFVPLTVSWELPCTTRPPTPKKGHTPPRKRVRTPGLEREGPVP